MKYLMGFLLMVLGAAAVAQDAWCGALVADSAEFSIYEHQPRVKDLTPLTVPVVVHVLHLGESLGEGTNISDEQIYSAIESLNYAYAGGYGGVDMMMEFCLASIDPEGNPSAGINRINACSSLPEYCDSGIAYEYGEDPGAAELAVKNLSRWPNQDYYNIWVVTEISGNNALGGIQAYAYFPTTSIVDGTVILYNKVGTLGNIKPNNENKALVHEIGHACGLYHTFASACEEPEGYCLFTGDRVCDTPPQRLSYLCGPSVFCPDSSYDNNFMAYYPEACRFLFTEGQRMRAHTLFLNSRSALLFSNVCATEPLAVEWLSFTGTKSGDDVQLCWETATESNSDFFEVEWQLDGNWEKVARITAAGNSSTTTTYSCSHKSPGGYYRLRQVDFNGDYIYSSIIYIDMRPPVDVEIYDITGRRVNGANLAPGIYIYKNGNSWEKRIVTWEK